MARDYRDQQPAERYYYGSSDDRTPQRRSHRRRHKHRDPDDDYIDPSTPKRERRERRKSEANLREAAELDINELRNHRAEYFTRPESDRRRDARPMAQEIRIEREKVSSRSTHRDSRRDRDSTKRRRRKERPHDERSDDEYVYGKPREEVRVRRSSSRRASDEGPSRRRLEGDSPRPISRKAASMRRVEVPKLTRYVFHLCV